jgi:molybdopterin molybdotransferase
LTTFEEALAIVLAAVKPLGTESMPLDRALGRFLSADLISVYDSPRFDNSAVDGFAVRSSDIAKASKQSLVTLKVSDTVFAGDDATKAQLAAGESARTMTGAEIVGGADAVVMQEDVDFAGGSAVFSGPATRGQAVRKQGEEFRAGDLLIGKGAQCTPSVLSLIAGQGNGEATVGRVPRVAVIVTGSELAKPGAALAPGQIYESNSVALCAAVRSLTGSDAVALSVGDDAIQTREKFESIAEDCDVVVFSGGASVGEKDLVRTTLLEAGVVEKFWRVSMKPGKPVFFGVHTGGALVFGLPGNPVSAQVTFELLVAPAILKMCGAAECSQKFEQAVLGACIKRRPGRKEFLRATTRIEGGRVYADPLRQQESHMVSGLAMADRLIVVESDVDCLEAGEVVDTVQLRWKVTA